MKTICAAILGLVLFAARAKVQAQVEFYDAPYYYNTNADGTVTLVGYTGPSSALPIPATINGLTVTAVGNGTSTISTEYPLISVAIPNYITSIQQFAFEGHTTLTSLVISNGVISIEGAASEAPA